MRSSASARHWFSLPKRQRMNKLERTKARASVNQAPVGTFVRAEDKKAPSSRANMSQPKATRNGFQRQTNRATRATMQVVMKVTRMTHTP